MLCYKKIRHKIIVSDDVYWDEQGIRQDVIVNIRILIKKFATKITTYVANKNDVFRVRKISHNMASKVIHNVNIGVEVPNKKVQLQCKKLARPPQLCKIANVRGESEEICKVHESTA